MKQTETILQDKILLTLSIFLAGESNRPSRGEAVNTYFDFSKAFDTALQDVSQGDCETWIRYQKQKTEQKLVL